MTYILSVITLHCAEQDDIFFYDHIHLEVKEGGNIGILVDQDNIVRGATIPINQNMIIKEEAIVTLTEIDEDSGNDIIGTLTIPAYSSKETKLIHDESLIRNSWYSLEYEVYQALAANPWDITGKPGKTNGGTTTPPNHNPPFVPSAEYMIMMEEEKEKKKMMEGKEPDTSAQPYKGSSKPKRPHDAMGGYSDDWMKP
jgi:hypothetical protein